MKRWVWIFLIIGTVAGFAPWPLARAQTQAPQQVIQKIEALVNDKVISAYDVGQRMGLILLATGQTIQNQQQLEQLRRQVLENLIDEYLEMQEADEYDVPAPDNEIEAAYNRVAANYGRTPDTFAGLLQQYGSSRETILTQIRAEFKWQTLVNGRYGNYAIVTDEEIDEYLKNLQANAGKQEYRISEIFLSVPDPSVDAIISERIGQVRKQLQYFPQFQAFARQFSQSTSAAQGGDIGWIGEDQMQPEIAAAVRELDVYAISEPIRAAAGYYIIAVSDRRKILEIDVLDELLDIKQIAWIRKKDTPQKESKAWADKAERVAQKFSSCANLKEAMRDLGSQASIRDLGEVALKSMNPELRKILQTMKANTMSKPLDAGDGYALFVVCSRRMPKVSLPSRETVQQQIEQQRIALMGRRYLRDLRRDAIIEYK